MTCATISVAPRLRTRCRAPPRGCGRSRPLARQESARATCGFRRSRSAPGRPPAVAARNAPQVLRGTSWTGRSSRQNRWHRDDRSNARAGGRGRVRRRTPPARRRATHAPARQGCGAAFRTGFRSPWLVLYKAARWLPLDAAGLVDHRERLDEAGERVSVGRRLAFLRGALEDRLLSFSHRLDDHLVEIGGRRPGAVPLGEQIEFGAPDVERGGTALLQRIAFDKADDVGDVLVRTVGDHGRRLTLGVRRLALLRLAGEIADLMRLLLVEIGRPPFGIPETL